LQEIVARMVDQRIAEAQPQDGIFQPFFQPREIANRIRDKQTVTEQNKWAYYFAEWGCLVCGTKEAIHNSVGMCEPCNNRTKMRLRAIIRKHTPANPSMPDFTDTVRLAREALRPAKALPPGSTARRRPK